MGMAVQEAEKEDARQSEEVAAAKSVVRVDAAELNRAYERNAFDADAKYKGKILEIRGMAGGVVTLATKTRLTIDGNVDCDFASSKKDELTGLEPLQNITVRGRCAGKTAGSSNVRLDHCSIVRFKRSPGTPTLKVTVDELQKSYEDNRPGEEKYTGKTIQLTGPFARQTTDNSGKTTIFLKAKGKVLITEVSCSFPASAKGSLRDFKPGDEVVLNGVCEGLGGLMVRVSDCEPAK
jgi:hypothetical protein